MHRKEIAADGAAKLECDLSLFTAVVMMMINGPVCNKSPNNRPLEAPPPNDEYW